ncbi:MAG: protease modulator HflK [Limisphaerales bacterium]
MSDFKLPDPPAPTPVPDPVSPAIDDASSEALSEALGASFRIVKVIMAGLVVLFFLSGMFVVKPNEVAVVLRFGKPVGSGTAQLRQPGWHFAFPYPLDEVIRIPVGQILTVTSTTGWHATSPELEAQNLDPDPIGMLRPEADGFTITADGNILHARATVKYRISDPLRYEFDFDNAPEILTNVLNNALIFASSRIAADAAIYRDKTLFRDTVIERVRAKIEELQLGISLEPSDVETKAPVDVRGAFDAVVAAEQERSRAISTAQGDRDEMIRTAVGEAQEIVNLGMSASNRLVSTVQAEAARFNDQLPYFQREPQLYKQRMLLAVLQRVLTNAQDKFFQPSRVDELRLQLNREPISKPAAERR